MRLRWYTKNVHPWGDTIGSYEECFPKILGIPQRITRFRTNAGRIRHYATSYTGLRGDGSYGVMWFRSLAETLAFLENAVATGMVPPT